jgi:hypothetical protein
MGTSVINPMIFYWMDVAADVEVLLIILGLVGLVVVCGLLVLEMVDAYDKPDIKWLKILFPITVLSFMVACLIPSKDTMLTMLVADMITYENIELTKESAMALVDYIVEQVKGITG